MKFGTVVSLPGSDRHFVLVKMFTKKISGHIMEKKFYALKDHPTVADETKPYTKARASIATAIGTESLTPGEMNDLFQLQKQKWEVYTN